MTDADQSGSDQRDDMNIGELAEDQLRHLTPIEELVEDLAEGREIWEYQIEEAVEHVEKTQNDATEILRRFEEQLGPIDSRPMTDGGTTFWEADQDCPLCGSEDTYTDGEDVWCGDCDWYDDGLRADGESDHSPPSMERPKPPEDPFACSLCGQPLGTVERIENEDYCDGCRREYGFDEVEHV